MAMVFLRGCAMLVSYPNLSSLCLWAIYPSLWGHQSYWIRTYFHSFILMIPLFFFHVHWYFACVCVCTRVSDTWSYKQLWAAIWGLEFEPRSSERIASTLSHWAISPVSSLILNVLLEKAAFKYSSMGQNVSISFWGRWNLTLSHIEYFPPVPITFPSSPSYLSWCPLLPLWRLFLPLFTVYLTFMKSLLAFNHMIIIGFNCRIETIIKNLLLRSASLQSSTEDKSLVNSAEEICLSTVGHYSF